MTPFREINLEISGNTVRMLLNPISMRQFAQFVKETNYITYFEKYEGSNWRDNEMLGRNRDVEEILGSESFSNMPATELTKIDAIEFLNWLGKGEIPTIEELAIFIEQIAVKIESNQSPFMELVLSESELGSCCKFVFVEELNMVNELNLTTFTVQDFLRNTQKSIDLESYCSSSFRYIVK